MKWFRHIMRRDSGYIGRMMLEVPVWRGKPKRTFLDLQLAEDDRGDRGGCRQQGEMEKNTSNSKM